MFPRMVLHKVKTTCEINLAGNNRANIYGPVCQMIDDPVFNLHIQHIYIVIDPSSIRRLAALFREKTSLIQDHVEVLIIAILNA